MSSFKDVYLTKRGTQLLARSVTEGLRLEFTKMVTGNGIYSEEERTKASLLERTELKSQKQEFGFSSVAVAESNIIKLKAMVTNIGLTEGYRITEIGIVARLEGKTEEEPILYSIAVAEEADYLPSQETPISYIQEYYTKISNAENIIINLEMGSYALAEDMQSVLKPQFKENEEIENIESGESIFSIFAKIKRAIRGLIEHKTSGDHDSRYYTEVEMDGKLSGKSDTTHNHDGRYLQKSAVINSNTVTEAGYALDARQANPNVSGSLGAQINSLNRTFTQRISELNTNLTNWGCVFNADSYNGTLLTYLRILYNDATHIAILTYEAKITCDISIDAYIGLFGINFKTSQMIYSTCSVRGGCDTSPQIRLDNNVISICSSSSAVNGKVIAGEIVFHYEKRW